MHLVFATKAPVRDTRSTPLTAHVAATTDSVFVRANGVTAAIKMVLAVTGRTFVPRENASLVYVRSQTYRPAASCPLGSWEIPPTEDAEVLSDTPVMYCMETAATKMAYADRFHRIVEMVGKSLYRLPELLKCD